MQGEGDNGRGPRRHVGQVPGEGVAVLAAITRIEDGPIDDGGGQGHVAQAVHVIGQVEGGDDVQGVGDGGPRGDVGQQRGGQVVSDVVADGGLAAAGVAALAAGDSQGVGQRCGIAGGGNGRSPGLKGRG